MSARLKFLTTIPILSAMLLLLLDSSTFMTAFSRGINAWALSVLPAILPFMVLCRILSLTHSNSTRCGKSILRLPAGAVNIILLSTIAGYPMGAKLICNSYNSGNMDTNNCIKVSLLASCASPIFIMATIGTALLGNSYCAIIILTAHILGAAVNYLLHYNCYNSTAIICNAHNNTTQGDIVLDSLLSVLIVGAYIALFSVLCEMILYILPSWCASDGLLITSYILGLLEMTTGCINICAIASTATATVLCCSLVSFGGLCITMQCMTFLRPCGIKYGTVLHIKCMHCAISTIICYVMTLSLL